MVQVTPAILPGRSVLVGWVRARRLTAAVLASFVVWAVSATPSDARLVELPTEAEIEAMQAIDALSALSAGFAQAQTCLGEAPVRVHITALRAASECPHPEINREWVYRSAPYVSFAGSEHYARFCARAAPRGPCVHQPQYSTTLAFMDIPGVAHDFATAWLVLIRPRSPRIPATDAEFLEALQSAPSIADRAEDLRRVQVQVEVAVRANRTIDAARLYRDALRTAPAWPEGHFNLGLLYGELELYPEAITAMRRYLHLAPNAPDARAVQDRIYEWEAAMAASAR